ncbi:MAG: glycerol-3-phosphate acyltransferase [Clostridia bacterium]|nr:glycerol-3-phosphate acyltransferase [Clostridia bacterium]
MMDIAMTGILCAAAVISYLLGGLNGAILFSKLVYHQDIRDLGSGNPGFTNFKRAYGLNAVTWAVLVFDVLKTALPVWITALLMGHFFDLWQFGAAFSGLFCMIGHCFPVWYRFKGGKAFIAGFATIWFVDWRMALVAVGVFFLVLVAFRYMSVASCTAALCCPVTLCFLGGASVWVLTLSALSAALVIVRHYPNFVKLAHHEESKFSFGSQKQL